VSGRPHPAVAFLTLGPPALEKRTESGRRRAAPGSCLRPPGTREVLKPLRAWQAYLFAAWYGLFFVLLAYLAAFMSFYLAYGLSLAVHAVLVFLYLRALVNRTAALLAMGATAAFLVLPTLAVILEGYTGLLYTLEIAAGLAGLMIFTTRPTFRQLVDELLAALFPARISHAQ
jgi:hypothetical protein